MEMSAVVRIFTMFLLCTLLLASQQRAVADASGIQQPDQQQEQRQQLNSKAKKSLSNWVQSYKEPKQGGEQQKAAEQEQEELTCTIKVQKVGILGMLWQFSTFWHFAG